MVTMKDVLTQKVKEELIRFFGPSSYLAQSLEDENTGKRFAEFVDWFLGEVELSKQQYTGTKLHKLLWAIKSLFVGHEHHFFYIDNTMKVLDTSPGKYLALYEKKEICCCGEVRAVRNWGPL